MESYKAGIKFLIILIKSRQRQKWNRLKSQFIWTLHYRSIVMLNNEQYIKLWKYLKSWNLHHLLMSNWKRYNMLLRYNYLLYSSKSVYSTNAEIPKVRLYRAIILSSPLIGCWPTERANQRAAQDNYCIEPDFWVLGFVLLKICYL